MRPLLPSAWLAVRRGSVPLPLVAAGLLVLGTLPWQDDGHAAQVMHGVAVLVACAFATSLDDPSGDLAAASPTRRSTWTAARLVATAAVALPVLACALVVARVRYDPLPTVVVLAESVGYLLAGIAVAAGLRAWRGTHLPSYPAVIGVLLVAMLTYALPRAWAMVDPQPWGPPYAAALWRWLGLVLVTVACLLVALRDPLDRPSGPAQRHAT